MLANGEGGLMAFTMHAVLGGGGGGSLFGTSAAAVWFWLCFQCLFAYPDPLQHEPLLLMG